MDAPTLETARLRLRGFQHADLDAYASFCADPELMRYIGSGVTLSRADAWRQMAYFVGHWGLQGRPPRALQPGGSEWPCFTYWRWMIERSVGPHELDVYCREAERLNSPP